MIRRVVDWILYSLRIKKRVRKPALETLADLLPLAVAYGIMRTLVAQFPKPRLSWFQWMVYKIKNAVRRWRFAVVGY